jgi:hypothetical protein
MGLVQLMRKLKVKSQDAEKIWFFKIGNFLRNENLRMYSLPIEVVKKNLKDEKILKLPDPRDFVLGMNFIYEKSLVKEKKKKSKETGGDCVKG